MQIEALQIPEGETKAPSQIDFELSPGYSCSPAKLTLSTSQRLKLTHEIKGMLHENLTELESQFKKL